MSDVKLSELIRKGAAMVEGRQCIDDYITLDANGEVCLCVLGAAYYALTGNLPISAAAEYEVEVTPTAELIVEGFSPPDLGRIRRMNDDGMTFDEIISELEAHNQ